MPAIESAQVVSFFLFDVAEAIDLARVPALIGTEAMPARLQPRPFTPAHIRYTQPPLVIEGETVQIPDLDEFKARFKVFDYGVVSLAISHSFTGEWEEMIAIGHRLIENEPLEYAAERAVRGLLDRLRPAITRPRTSFLTEDYLVVAVHRLNPPIDADALIERHGDDLAVLLRGEREPLSRQERDEILRHRLSYFASDLVIPTWNAAFVYDKEEGARAALEILEFANSQLLQFRYYDALLEAALGQIYADLQKPRWAEPLIGRRYAGAATRVHSLFIDVNELTSRTENALTIVGDVYAARLFDLAAVRLALPRWKESVREKLETLDDIFRFAVERTALARGHFLELTIVLILVFELVLFFMGVMK